jgi:hypothetical protein
VDPPYPSYGGLFKEEAVMMLRRFYIQENERGKWEASRAFLLCKTHGCDADVCIIAPENLSKKNRELKEVAPEELEARGEIDTRWLRELEAAEAEE